MLYNTKTLLCALIALLLPAFLLAQTPSPLNLAQVGHLPLYAHGQTGGLIANDVTAFTKNGVDYAVVGFYKGTSIISLADHANPVEIAFLPAQNGGGNDWRDIEYWAGYAYVSQEGEGTGVPSSLFEV